MLADFIDALQATCTNTLKRVREAFVKLRRPNRREAPMSLEDFHQLTDNIERALYTFESTSNQAVLRVYRRNLVTSATASSTSVSDIGDDNELLTQNDDSEIIFLVYL